MESAYGPYHIDATPLAEGGRYYARAKISFVGVNAAPDSGTIARPATGQEVKWSGDLGQFGSLEEAAECGQNWAVEWCNQHPASEGR